jgi:hypothetical protein
MDHRISGHDDDALKECFRKTLNDPVESYKRSTFVSLTSQVGTNRYFYWQKTIMKVGQKA